MSWFTITKAVEDEAIRIRRTAKLKLPDALILATSMVHHLKLITLDKKLLEVAKSEGGV